VSDDFPLAKQLPGPRQQVQDAVHGHSDIRGDGAGLVDEIGHGRGEVGVITT
jgi:hypothetical protein